MSSAQTNPMNSAEGVTSDPQGKVRPELISTAILLVQRMSMGDKERLAQEIFRVQPNLMAMVVVQTRFGASEEEIGGLTNILLTCFTAAKLSALPMTEVGDAQQAACLARVNTYLQSIEGSSAEAEASAYITQHPEPAMLAFVMKEIDLHGFKQASDATYGKLVLTAMGLVECFAVALRGGLH